MPIDRKRATQREKYLGFKAAVETYNSYVHRGEHLAAFVIAFSILEDRLTACYMLACDRAGVPRPAGFVTFDTKVNALAHGRHIVSATAADWRSAGRERNRLLHAAMWDLGAATAGACAAAMKRARSADQVVKRLNRSA